MLQECFINITEFWKEFLWSLFLIIKFIYFSIRNSSHFRVSPPKRFRLLFFRVGRNIFMKIDLLFIFAILLQLPTCVKVDELGKSSRCARNRNWNVFELKNWSWSSFWIVIDSKNIFSAVVILIRKLTPVFMKSKVYLLCPITINNYRTRVYRRNFIS